MLAIKSFLFCKRKVEIDEPLPAVSLFSGAGLSDLGYELNGFDIVVQEEKEKNRATLCAENFLNSEVIIGELDKSWKLVVKNYQKKRPKERLALLSITPPCQGMSSSNPGRGRLLDASTNDKRNLLLLDAIPVIKSLKPRIVVVENVQQVLNRVINVGESPLPLKLMEAFQQGLGKDYLFFSHVVEMADYGVPQNRCRAILVLIHIDEMCCKQLEENQRLPLPRPTHAERPKDGCFSWITLEDWFYLMDYPSLDAKSKELACDASDPLHFVPVYTGNRYLMVADIPPKSGRNAYQNNKCHACGRKGVLEGTATCPSCGELMHNRPYVKEKNGSYRLIKGFKSSYRRMYHNRPASTITTASSHIGSDYKIHPWEHRVLSIRECADLQTVPRFYDWNWAIKTQHTYLARQVIGEALPSFFTFLHGSVLRDLLNCKVNPDTLLKVPDKPFENDRR